eukprot:6114547-Amphidinium_carterae.1
MSPNSRGDPQNKEARSLTPRGSCIKASMTRCPRRHRRIISRRLRRRSTAPPSPSNRPPKATPS